MEIQKYHQPTNGHLRWLGARDACAPKNIRFGRGQLPPGLILKGGSPQATYNLQRRLPYNIQLTGGICEATETK